MRARMTGLIGPFKSGREDMAIQLGLRGGKFLLSRAVHIVREQHEGAQQIAANIGCMPVTSG